MSDLNRKSIGLPQSIIDLTAQATHFRKLFKTDCAYGMSQTCPLDMISPTSILPCHALRFAGLCCLPSDRIEIWPAALAVTLPEQHPSSMSTLIKPQEKAITFEFLKFHHFISAPFLFTTCLCLCDFQGKVHSTMLMLLN